MKPEALGVQKRSTGIPSSWPASRVKLMTPSDTMQVTGGILFSEEELSFERSSLKGAKQFFFMDSHKDGMCWVEFASVGGRPSGIVSN